MELTLVAVGEAPGNDVAITVTGLKPNHFYNIRVVAMGPNNFQAASQTVRLRTFSKDGKPFLGNARLPTNFVDDDLSKSRTGEPGVAQDGSASSSAAAIEIAPPLDLYSSTNRESGSNLPGQRRNTVNRRHSPSVASADQPSIKSVDNGGPEQSLDELSRQFSDIRKEIHAATAQSASDEQESQQIEDELKKEKETKRISLKEKEEQTAGLKTLMRNTMEAMRAAEKERTRKEQQLKDKESKKTKIRETISKLEKDIEGMRSERESFQAQKAQLEKQRDSDVRVLYDKIAGLQEDHNQLEAELSNKGKQLNEMKEARKHLAGAEDEQTKETDEMSRREWEALRSHLHQQLVEETKAGQHLDQQLHALANQITMHSQAFFNRPEPVDMDTGPSAQHKRLSHNSNDPRLSPPGQFPLADSPSQLPLGLAPRSTLGFGPVLFMPSSSDPQTEEDLKAAGGPLSPSAQAYLPSGIIDTESDTKGPQSPMLPEAVTAGEEDQDEEAQSPSSSIRSYSVLSSPHSSSHNLPFPQYQDGADRGSPGSKPPPTSSPAGGLRLTSLLSGFQRSSRATRPTDDEGPPMGSLKPGQSQSFPRGTDENEPPGSRRRLSFSLKGHRNSTGLEGSQATPFGGSRILTKRLNPFASSGGSFFSDRDPDISRPASIASTDLPRPSTDSGSIWGAPGDHAALSKSRLWSPGEGRWASRSGSRRPSIHGSPSALTTSLASADDEILYETELNDPHTLPSQVGVIGSRPPAASAASLSQRLNPAAPTFMGFFKKDRDVSSEKEKGKARDKDRAKDKLKDPKSRDKEATSPLDLPSSLDDSPSNPRMSRDAYSVHTQTSVSESHDSLPLEASSSSTHLDTNASVASSSREADSVNGIRKLLRKGSSSKFSLSSRLGKDSSLFKKGPGSAANSDKNTSAEHRSSIGDLDELGEDPGYFGRSYDSVSNSPFLGSAKSKETKESRMTNWRFMKKKGKETPSKEKESLEMDRAPDED